MPSIEKQDFNGLRFVDVEPKIQDLIKQEHPEVTSETFFSFSELLNYRIQLISSQLQEDKINADAIDQQIIDSIRHGKFISMAHKQMPSPTLGQRVADKIAHFGGSWTFILLFLSILLIWMLLNMTALFFQAFDPYPFILLNLVLSCLAAIQAPIIMMSQNRQAQRDRQESDNDYAVNLKAEIEIRLLHEKMDHLLNDQMKHFHEMQAIQAEQWNRLQQEVDQIKQ